MHDIYPDFERDSLGEVYLPQLKASKNKSMNETRPLSASRLAVPVIIFGLGLVLIAVSAFLISRNTSLQNDFATVPVKVNFPAPEVTLNDTRGVTRSLAEYRGQVVLVNLWATWCPPCKEEMPTLQAFYNEHNAEGFTIIAINDGDPEADVLQFEKDYRLSFPIWLDPEYSSTEEAFKTVNLPTSFVIDREGTVRLMWVGGISRRALDQYVIPIIMEKQ